MASSRLLFSEKAPSQMFDRVLNTPLIWVHVPYDFKSMANNIWTIKCELSEIMFLLLPSREYFTKKYWEEDCISYFEYFESTCSIICLMYSASIYHHCISDEDIFRVHSLFCCLLFSCDISKSIDTELNCHKKEFLSARFMEKYGQNLMHNNLSACAVLYHLILNLLIK